MRRLVSILLVVLISIVLIVSCDADKAGNGGGSKPDSPSSVNMTDSYKTGRENFHFVTGVWLPELENIELIGSSDFSTTFGSFAEACFDILGDKTLYDSIATYLEALLGEPVNKEAKTQAWNLARTVDGKDYEGEIFMIYDDNDAEHTAIYINCILSLKSDYSSYRTLIYEKSGILMPELANAQALDSSEANILTTRTMIQLDLAYDAQIFNMLVHVLKAGLPRDPLMDETDIASWEYLVDADGSVHESPAGESEKTSAKINWEVKKGVDAQGNVFIRIMFLKRNYFTVSISAETGGSVQMKASGKAVEGNSFRGTDDWNLVLTATADSGYSFEGWYKGDSKVYSKNPYDYSPRDNETIVARFTKAPDNMTDSYRAARKSVYDSSGIWLPELEGVEITNTDITEDGAKPLVNISFAGDETLFNQIATYLNEKIGNNPDMNEANTKWWEMEYTDNGQIYVGNISIYLDQGIITIASHFFRGFTVTLTASPAAGGTVSFKLAGTPVAGPSLTEAENSDMDLVATPATGYEFAGWYRNNTLVSDKANYTDFKVPSENVTIEARFSEKQTAMTDYYSTGRQKLIEWNLLTLPELEDLDYSLGMEGISWWTSSSDLCFDFDIGVTEDAYNAIKGCIEALCGTTQTEENPRIDYDENDPSVIVQIDNWWTYDGKAYNLCFDIENEGLYLNIIQSST